MKMLINYLMRKSKSATLVALMYPVFLPMRFFSIFKVYLIQLMAAALCCDPYYLFIDIVEDGHKKVLFYNGTTLDTVKDIKKFIKNRTKIPMWSQRLRPLLETNDNIQVPLKHHRQCVKLHFDLLPGPEDKTSIYSSIWIEYKDIVFTMQTKPYWYMNGRNGLLARILDIVDDLLPNEHHNHYQDFSLVDRDGIVLNGNEQLRDINENVFGSFEIIEDNDNTSSLYGRYNILPNSSKHTLKLIKTT